MTPGARVAATIELLDEIVSHSERPADLVANAFFRARRFIGGGDRRAVSERAWGILRRYGQLTWWLDRTRHPERGGRALVAAELMLVEGMGIRDLEALFDGGRYRPSMLDEAEYRALRQMEGHSLPHPEQPDWVRLNVQEWVAPHLKEAYGEAWGREVAALETPPPVDLRVNRLKGTVAQARAALAEEGIDTEPMRYAADGLRLRRRLSVVAGEAFQNGLVEIQDEGSQLVAALVDGKPGMQIVDYCAGAGGKTLAIAAGMNNKGRVVAMDVLETRLDRSAQRLRRAGAHNVERRAIDADSRKWLKRQAGAFDRVLVDAPCTGTGTWRRNPDGRWTLRPQDLEELVPKQAAILDAAARLVKPGGGLVYATCSVLPAENERQIEAFLERNTDFEVVPVAAIWREVLPTEPPADVAQAQFLRLSPLKHGTDGFFAATLARKSSAVSGSAGEVSPSAATEGEPKPEESETP
ncbi:MAG: RsmB/NOP family class I SAM-dependent RNA methyltransferase [Reyranella sp.]|uniref:RsmB/NOP family class I SAM-dependent RNA methyltransferase n=1 Tax=Reyranella sp. TaxID=1929291 RepID=UPI0025CC5A31|nr:RsmB/NOP family class I SAM-dependent RNA methyltransferase [Reyranella sp.]MBR2818188.1 RsmB/NOP family class I SAM-dependent RNA methyltransferase [Reyranella sp.]